MKNQPISDLKKAKARALMDWVDPPCGISLTGHLHGCDDLRKSLDIDRSEFDEIIQYLIDAELIYLNQVFRNVGFFLTEAGQALCESER